jgi:hypothetical protein
MANYRQIHVSIWKDEWFLDLEPQEKLLFIYLFSNESTSLSGLYKLPLKVIAFETCLNIEFIKTALNKFESSGKAYYKDGMIWIVNMRIYNRGGETVYARIVADIDAIPDCELKRIYLERYPKHTITEPSNTLPIDYTYPTDTNSEVVCNEMKCNEMNINEMNINEELSSPNGAKPLPELSIGQVFILDAFGAKRFKTHIQRDSVLENENKYGLEYLKQYITWAAKRGMSLGDAISGMDKALPKWGKPKGEVDIHKELEDSGYTHRRAE